MKPAALHSARWNWNWRCARGSSACTACSPGRGTSRPDRSRPRCARTGGDDALVLLRSSHQASLYFVGLDLAGEHVPAPLVDHDAERQERDLLERHLHLHVDRRLVVLRDLSSRPSLLQVLGRHRQRDRVADRLVEAVVGAALKEDRQLVVRVEVVVVTELVVDRDQVFLVRLDAHLDAQVVRRTCTSHALAWQTTSLPVGLVNIERSQNVSGSGSRPSDVKKRLAELHHLLRVVLLRERRRDVERRAPLYGSSTG